jgi:hypothetical protein
MSNNTPGVEDLIRWYAGGINECEGGGYDEAILAGRRAIAEHDKEVIEKSAKQIRECAMFKWEKEAYDEAYSTGYLRGHIDGYFQGRADEFDAYARSGPTTHNEEETS